MAAITSRKCISNEVSYPCCGNLSDDTLSSALDAVVGSNFVTSVP